MKSVIRLYRKLIVTTTFLALLFQVYDLVSGNLNKVFIEINLVGFNRFIMIIQILIVVIKEVKDLLRILSLKLYFSISRFNIKTKVRCVLNNEYIISFSNEVQRLKLCVNRC